VEIMDPSCNQNRFRDVTRTDREIFLLLLNVLQIKESKYIRKGEKLLIWLSMTAGNSNRAIQERFQHSGETISSVIKEVTKAILCIKESYIKDPSNEVQQEIISSTKFYPFFQNCIGALDGTHIKAIVSEAHVKPFRNRKGFISQNVLAVCNFDMTFSFVLAGWEGSAHDSRVLEDGVDKGLHLPPGKFYLGDAGYGLKGYLLTPYRGVRYHLKKWGRQTKDHQVKKNYLT
jgi:hypothetical protein